jgi:hypothetical protein
MLRVVPGARHTDALRRRVRRMRTNRARPIAPGWVTRIVSKRADPQPEREVGSRPTTRIFGLHSRVGAGHGQPVGTTPEVGHGGRARDLRPVGAASGDGAADHVVPAGS